MSSLRYAALACLGLLPSLPLRLSADEAVAEARPFEHRCVLRGTAVPSQGADLLTRPGFIPLQSIVPDGTWVEKGGVVAEFDAAEAKAELERRMRESEVVEAELQAELRKIENREMEMKDRLANLEGKLEVALARLADLKSLPRQSEVDIAEGRARIARLELNAAEEELKRVKISVEKGFASVVEQAGAEKLLALRQAGADLAESELLIARLPAEEEERLIQELEISTIEAELKLAKFEISQGNGTAKLQRHAASAKKVVLTRRIQQAEESVNGSVYLAPVAGFVRHGEHRTRIEPGVKFFPDFRFASIPDLKSLDFRTWLPESDRPFFEPGAKAEISVYGRADVHLVGTVEEIASLPIDLAERQKVGFGSKVQPSGIKVYEALVKLDAVPEWLRTGMHAEIRLLAHGAPRPAVPLSMIRMNSGRPWLARDGRFEEIRGSADAGWFYFNDPAALGRSFSSEGSWPRNDGDSTSNTSKIQAVMGEVHAASAAIVALPDVARDSRISWILDEESIVKPGDLIAKLDPSSAERERDTADSELASAQAKRDSAASDTDMARREHDFKKLKEDNELQQFVLKLRKQNGQAPEDPAPKPALKLGTIEIPAGSDRKAFLKAKRDLCAATAELAAAKLELHRLQARPSEFVSPAELEKIGNTCHRQELFLSKAQIELAWAIRGPTLEDRAKNNQEYFEKKTGAYRSIRRIAMDLAKKIKDQSQAESELAIKKNDVKSALGHLASAEIRAPAAGLLRYERIWDSGALRRPSTGVVVRDGSRLFSIPDTSKLAVVVQLPEHRYAKIKIGEKVRVRLPSDSSAGELEGVIREVGSLFEAVETRSTGGNQAEPLGETVFSMVIDVNTAGRKLKPGALAEVIFP